MDAINFPGPIGQTSEVPKAPGTDSKTAEATPSQLTPTAKDVNTKAASVLNAANQASNTTNTTSTNSTNSTGSEKGVWDQFKDTAEDWTNRGEAFLQQGLEQGALAFEQFSDAISYDGLRNASKNTFDSCQKRLGDLADSVSNNGYVQNASEWASSGSERITAGVNTAGEFTANNALPLTFTALAALATVGSLKCAANSIKNGNWGRSVLQICLGLGSAALGLRVAYQSPAGQQAEESVRGLFN